MIKEFLCPGRGTELREGGSRSGCLADWEDRRGGDGPAGGLGEGGEADFESFGFAGPALLLGFGDAVAQVVADTGQAGSLGWVGPQEGTSDAAVLVDAAGPVGAAAVAERDPAALEIAEA